MLSTAAERSVRPLVVARKISGGLQESAHAALTLYRAYEPLGGFEHWEADWWLNATSTPWEGLHV